MCVFPFKQNQETTKYSRATNVLNRYLYQVGTTNPNNFLIQSFNVSDIIIKIQYQVHLG